jgi:hypothetical protein
MSSMSCLRIAVFHVALLTVLSAQCAVADEAKIRIVFFTPADVDPPAGVPSRMKEVVDYGQAFYSKWLNHWGYEPENVLPIDRGAGGVPMIYYVRGDKAAASGAYDNVGFQEAVREQAIQQYKLPRQGSTWWIFVYGTKLKASRGVGGFGDSKGYGWALLVWHEVPGKLPLDMAMSRRVADLINLKGYLHELGHTMNLPHFGPLDRMSIGAGEGMSLMGPNTRTYRKARRNREEKVHLNHAVAALIWKTPQMTGRYEAQPRTPKVEVDDFKSIYDSKRNRFRLTGQLKSNVPAHSIVAIDDPMVGPKDYWKKAYAARLSEDGQFELFVDELSPSSGTLQVVFCFDNGYVTGNGQGYGFKFSANIPYKYDKKTFTVGVDAQ